MIIYEIVYVTNDGGYVVATSLPFSRILVYHQPQILALWRVARWSEQRKRGLL